MMLEHRASIGLAELQWRSPVIQETPGACLLLSETKEPATTLINFQ